MKKMLSIFRGIIPAPALCDLSREGGCFVLKSSAAELPEGFPDAVAREKILKESGSVAAFLCGNGQYFCKIYKYRRFLHSLKRIFRTPRAFRCFAGAQRLAELGFQTPEPVAAAVYYKGIIPMRQVLLTRSLPADTVYFHKAFEKADIRQAEALLSAVTAFAAKLHQAGFIHGDMSFRNIYLLPDGQSFGLIDLDGIMHYPAGVPRIFAAREVARLISSAYRSYLLPEIPREEWLQAALQSYRDAGGKPLCKQDIAGTLTRLERHRNPVKKKH
jgi:hypothetical protein